MRRAALTILAALVVLAVAGVAIYGFTDSGDSEKSARPSTPGPSTSSSALATGSVFGDAPATAGSPTPDAALGTPIRSRYVSFRSQVLPTTADGQELTFAFFPDATFVGTVDSIDRQALLTSWSGPLDEPHSLFVITRTGDRYQVTASTTEGSFTMDLSSNGSYVVQEVDQPTVLDGGGIDVPTTPSAP